MEFLIMGVKGQSLLEFLVMMPALFGLALIMIKINTAIQISIVNQQYARAQGLFLTFNSPTYPELRFRYGDERSLVSRGFNQLVLGVSQEGGSEDLPADQLTAVATTQSIVRNKRRIGSNQVQAEPNDRGVVRVRTIVSLCTQSNIVNDAGGVTAILPGNTANPVDNTFLAQSEYKIPETPSADAWAMCRSPFEQ
jgi:hypothetical protein